jgi:hypothetical protein
MPIYLHLANLIVDEKAINNKYYGGIKAFRKKYIKKSLPYNQEDNQIFSISKMNADEFDIDELTSNGLSFDEKNRYSNDFVICLRYGGFLWSVEWLSENRIHAWHINCEVESKNWVERISKMSFDEIVEMSQSGFDPLITIKKKHY